MFEGALMLVLRSAKAKTYLGKVPIQEVDSPVHQFSHWKLNYTRKKEMDAINLQ